ncbi:hypothetical protein [Rhodococcus sp. NBC_00297]|uniref:hypothetical protein n=1 Tax=Rhodococcus sp. NBC_00297 TaxID=2976005 RepID=UPI002E2CB0A7|nr:hypothetical protein [Rhodococcus sp. NBC_00297]
MTVAVLVMVVALVLHCVAARTVSRENRDRLLPTTFGPYPVRPARKVRRLQTIGWLLSLWAALRIADVLWSTQPWLGMGLAVSAILVINGAPSLIVTLMHNRRIDPSPI